MAPRSFMTSLLIICAVGSLSAQSSVAIGPELGFYKAQDDDAVRGMGGVAVRVRLSDLFAVEGSINVRQESYYYGFVKVRNWPVMVTGLIFPIPILYGALGAGWYNSSISYDVPAGFLGGPATLAVERTQAFGWHFGGGLEAPLGSAIRIYGDVKYVFLQYDFKSLPGSNGVKSNFSVLTVGILFDL